MLICIPFIFRFSVLTEFSVKKIVKVSNFFIFSFHIKCLLNLHLRSRKLKLHLYKLKNIVGICLLYTKVVILCVTNNESLLLLKKDLSWFTKNTRTYVGEYIKLSKCYHFP